MNFTYFILLCVSLFIYSCMNENSQQFISESKKIIDSPNVEISSEKIPVVEKNISDLEKKIINEGLVNIRSLDSNIIVDLRYSTENNFLKKDVYGDFCECYLQREVAEKLLNAQRLLKNEFPQYNLMIFDCVRPRAIQWKMWEMLDMPDSEKVKYVSNPKYGSLHNFGAAVDLTIADENNNELDMGTPYDFFGELAHPVREQEFFKKGELTTQQIENRRLLRRIMYGSDFFNIQTEWWHFNSCYRKEAIEKNYPLIE